MAHDLPSPWAGLGPNSYAWPGTGWPNRQAWHGMLLYMVTFHAKPVKSDPLIITYGNDCCLVGIFGPKQAGLEFSDLPVGGPRPF